MRIGIDIRCLLDEPRSGVGEYTFNFLQRILQNDKKNEYVLFTSGFNKSKFYRLKKLFDSFSNVSFYHLRWPNKFINILWWLNLGPNIDSLLKVNTLWFPHFNFAKFSPSCRTIVTCHDVSFINLKDLFSLKGRLWHWFVRPLRFYKKADVILSVSQSTKNDLLNLGISKEKVEVIYPIVSAQLAQDSYVKNNKNYNLPEKYFFYVGTLDARKNIISLLEAFIEFRKKYMEKIYLIIGGRLGWHSRRYYKKIFALINKDKHISYLGYIDRKKLPHFYQHALAFVYPSFYEGFGFPPLEAMQNNCPVISSYSSSLTEVVKDAALLIDPYNKNDLVKGFLKISNEVELRDDFIQKGKKVVSFWEKEQEVSYKKLVTILSSG